MPCQSLDPRYLAIDTYCCLCVLDRAKTSTSLLTKSRVIPIPNARLRFFPPFTSVGFFLLPSFLLPSLFNPSARSHPDFTFTSTISYHFHKVVLQQYISPFTYFQYGSRSRRPPMASLSKLHRCHFCIGLPDCCLIPLA
jgi:hypothetical protein